MTDLSARLPDVADVHAKQNEHEQKLADEDGSILNKGLLAGYEAVEQSLDDSDAFLQALKRADTKKNRYYELAGTFPGTLPLIHWYLLRKAWYYERYVEAFLNVVDAYLDSTETPPLLRDRGSDEQIAVLPERHEDEPFE